MKTFKFILIFLLSIPQTLCSWKVINAFLNPITEQGFTYATTKSPTETPGFWVAAIFLVVISAAVMWLRIGHEEYPWFLALFTVVDILLSPLAVLRVLVALIIAIATREAPETHFIDDADEKALCFLFYASGDGYACDTPGKIFRTQLFAILPLTALLSASAWLLIATLTERIAVRGVYYPLSFLGLTLFGVLLAYAKSETIVTSHSSYITEFRHGQSGSTTLRYGGNYASSQGDGWYKRSQWMSTWTSEKTPGLVIRTILNVILSPVFVFGQLLGVLAALVGIFTYHVQSNLGPANYADVPLGIFQWPLGYLCSFTIR